MINFEWGHTSQAVVRGSVVSEGDATGERRPDGIMVVGKEPKTAIPISPEHFDGASAPCVMTKGRRCPDVGSLSQQSEGFRQELGGRVRVQGGGRSECKDEPVEEWLQPGLCLSVRERDHNHIA